MGPRTATEGSRPCGPAECTLCAEAWRTSPGAPCLAELTGGIQARAPPGDSRPSHRGGRGLQTSLSTAPPCPRVRPAPSWLLFPPGLGTPCPSLRGPRPTSLACRPAPALPRKPLLRLGLEMPSGPGLDLPPVHPAGAPRGWAGSLKSPQGHTADPLTSPDPLDTTAGPVPSARMDTDASAPLVPRRGPRCAWSLPGPAPRMTSGPASWTLRHSWARSVRQLARTRQSQGHSPQLCCDTCLPRPPQGAERAIQGTPAALGPDALSRDRRAKEPLSSARGEWGGLSPVGQDRPDPSGTGRGTSNGDGGQAPSTGLHPDPTATSRGAGGAPSNVPHPLGALTGAPGKGGPGPLWSPAAVGTARVVTFTESQPGSGSSSCAKGPCFYQDGKKRPPVPASSGPATLPPPPPCRPCPPQSTATTPVPPALLHSFSSSGTQPRAPSSPGAAAPHRLG